MRGLKLSSLIAAVLMASSAMTQAADLPLPPVEDYPPEVIPQGVATGWYIRGDIGYAGFEDPDVYYEPVPGVGYQNFSKASLDSTWSLSGGIGYQITDYFRVDATVSHYFDSDFDGRSSSGATFDCGLLSPDNGTSDAGGCSVSDTGSLEATTYMANAYVDLGTYNGFTPYVGAGMGVAKVRWDELNNNISCSGGGDCTGNNGEDYNSSADSWHKGKKENRFAWAIYTGASFDVDCRTKIDAGYSYTRIQGGDFFGYGGTATTAAAAGTSGYHKDIGIHEGSLGLRYALDDTGCAAPVVPVVYK